MNNFFFYKSECGIIFIQRNSRAVAEKNKNNDKKTFFVSHNLH